MNEMDGRILVRRLMTAFELFEAGREMRRQQLLRQSPEASDDEIRRMVCEWLAGATEADRVPPGFVRSDRFL